MNRRCDSHAPAPLRPSRRYGVRASPALRCHMGETPSLCTRVGFGTVTRVNPRIRRVVCPECRSRRRPDGLPRQKRRAAGPHDGRCGVASEEVKSTPGRRNTCVSREHTPPLSGRESAKPEASTARCRIDELQNTVTLGAALSRIGRPAARASMWVPRIVSRETSLTGRRSRRSRRARRAQVFNVAAPPGAVPPLG
jgi:hypothetical protein